MKKKPGDTPSATLNNIDMYYIMWHVNINKLHVNMTMSQVYLKMLHAYIIMSLAPHKSDYCGILLIYNNAKYLCPCVR